MSREKSTTTKLKKHLIKLSSLPDEASRRNYIDCHPRLVCPAIVEQIADAVRENVRVDVTGALAVAEAAVLIAEKLHDDESQARALRAKGNVLWFRGRCKPAVRLLERAVRLFQKAGHLSEVGRTLSTSIQPLALLGEYERALSAAERAGEIFRWTGEDLRLARLEINIANVLHRRGHITEALACYERAYKQLLAYKDIESIGVALHNMAVCLIGLNDFHGALETYETAQKFCQQHSMPLLVAQADYNIAYLHYLRGDYNRALEILRRTREACRDNSDAYHWALCNLDQSEIYLELNLINEAEELAREAARQFEQQSLSYESMKALTNVAIAMSRKGNASGALKGFAQARRKAAAEENPVWRQLIDLYRALVLLDQGQLSKTQHLATTALKFFSSYPLPGKAAMCHLLLARVGLQAGNLKEAYRHCCLALEHLRKLDAPMMDYQAHLVTGHVQEAEGNLEAAHNSYQAARLALERLRSSLRGEEIKIAFMKDRQEVYERLIQLCLRRSPDPRAAEEAFLYMEEAKSRGLRELLFSRLWAFFPSDSESEEFRSRLRDLRQELNWYYGRIEAEQLSRKTIRPEKIQTLQVEARIRENEFQHILREHSLDTIDERLQISTTVTIEKIRAAFGKETTLVEYFRVRDRLVAAVLNSGGLRIFPLCPLSRVAHLMHSLQFQLSRVRLHRKTTVHFERSFVEATHFHLKALYDQVVAPLCQSFQGSHLIFVPHDILHCLPFHALSDGTHYLVDSFTISYAPSASIYTLCHTRPANNSGSCLILGVPDSKTPHILNEVQSVAAALPRHELLVGSEVSLEVLKRKGPKSSVIHMATHGYFRHDNPLFSGIRLGDSYLNFYDLYRLHLPVQLLTLSGCSTGLNGVAAGDELLGLTRGLLYAGAQSLLVTLWDVDDSSTAKLMERFYSLMPQNGKAHALRAAMLEIRKEYPHPYYWAPFMLVGKVFCY
jgi:CHAT domain-containing protein/tetratricopeptide (TPR) repeat protein